MKFLLVFGVMLLIAGCGAGSEPEVEGPQNPPAEIVQNAVAYQMDVAHSGKAVFGQALSFPAAPTWKKAFPKPVSYPLIVGNRVFVITSSELSATAASLYALDKSTGNTVWGPVDVASNWGWAAHAYDQGRLFVVNSDNDMRAYDAETGNLLWNVNLPDQGFSSAAPIAKNGAIYTVGDGFGANAYALRQTDGSIIWNVPIHSGSSASPSWTENGLIIPSRCHSYSLALSDGGEIWRHDSGCSSSIGQTAPFYNNAIYAGRLYDAAFGSVNTQLSPIDGSKLGEIFIDYNTGYYPRFATPAFSENTGYFLILNTLHAVNLADNSLLWSFSGDGQLVSNPLMIDSTLIIGSASGKIYALNSMTGTVKWSAFAGAAIEASQEGTTLQPLTAFGAGTGYLITPAGKTLSAWHLAGPR